MTDHLTKAIELACKAHAGQEDKAGQPYILHPLRVMMKMSTEMEMVAAVLHDVEEDTADADGLKAIGYYQFVDTYSPDGTLASILTYLNKRPGQTYLDYISDIAQQGGIVRKVKWYDILDNIDPKRLEALNGDSRIYLERKYLRALAILGECGGEELVSS